MLLLGCFSCTIHSSNLMVISPALLLQVTDTFSLCNVSVWEAFGKHNARIQYALQRTSNHAAPNTVPPIILHIIMFLEVMCIIILTMCFSHVEILKYIEAAV